MGQIAASASRPRARRPPADRGLRRAGHRPPAPCAGPASAAATARAAAQVEPRPLRWHPTTATSRPVTVRQPGRVGQGGRRTRRPRRAAAPPRRPAGPTSGTARRCRSRRRPRTRPIGGAGRAPTSCSARSPPTATTVASRHTARSAPGVADDPRLHPDGRQGGQQPVQQLFVRGQHRGVRARIHVSTLRTRARDRTPRPQSVDDASSRVRPVDNSRADTLRPTRS